MINDIFPHHFNNTFIAVKKIRETDFVLNYNENSVLLKADGDKLDIPQRKDFPEISDKTEIMFLFALNDIPCFLIWDNLKVEKPDLIFKEISFFRTTRHKEIAWICIAGFHLRNWYLQNRFCGKCGSVTMHKSDERAIICPDCNNITYPKISPAIIVAITSNDKILLARNSNFPGKWYSLIAGYVEIGESLEQTVKREVKEEVGLDIRNIRYYKSQPWPLSGSMMIGFVAQADENQPVCIDKNEITEAAWFTRGNLPQYPLNISISGEMIEKFDKEEL